MWAIAHLRRLMQTSKIMIFQPIYSSIGWWLARAQPDSSGCKRGPILDRTPFHCKAHSHPHSHCRHTSSSNCITETWWGEGETCKFHTNNGPSQESCFFFFSHQHYNEKTLTRTMSSEDLLYRVHALCSDHWCFFTPGSCWSLKGPAAAQTTKKVWEKDPSSFCWQISSTFFTFS